MANVTPPAYYPPHNFIVMTPAPAPAPGPGSGPALAPAVHHVSCYQVFQKAEPKALGTVQIMIGIMTLLFGVVLTITGISFIYYTGCTIWASVLYISAGALTVAGANFQNPCVIKASLVMNVISAVAAGISVVLLSIDVAVGHIRSYAYYYDSRSYSYYTSYYFPSLEGQSRGISGVLLVLCLLQFIISICVSAFGCKSICRSQPMSVYVVPNPNMTNTMVQYTPSAPVMSQQTVAM